ncbi:molybdopterin-guanine dinucleotide biosynthesis protein B [Cytobacillus purgationiresistens]|uniref:Molybdopterin-guanine dinucleotide biosynthesis protein B n=1 Tax=Cytobacillus purgationiresistens TaxID=863449 RepID=A0ABU0ABZ1_9BACI|nr:molybdopterin-guanine dinucleotide biosynthesis protein B [Cytobacillus purgationiresistens]MDQ0268767.1 molybdopterin-guanine dinucleotide biosynthesis protein B [Cytobacillus purgationiresistens]
MAMVNPPLVFQIVGYQNSGKTTLVTKLIKQLADRELSVVTLKHHGHGGRPDIAENKDTAQHMRSGALASIVEGDGSLVLQAEKAEWALSEQIALASRLGPKIVLIEGHKKASFPKAVLLRSMDDAELLETLNHIVMVFYWEEAVRGLQAKYKKIPFFQVNDEEGFAYLINYFNNIEMG